MLKRQFISRSLTIAFRAKAESRSTRIRWPRHAGMCQEAGLVPIVEPDVIMGGNHTLGQSFGVERVLRTAFDQLYAQRQTLEGMLLKPNIVLPESTCPTQVGVGEIAGTTVGCLLSVVLAAVSWSAFPSGCQTAELSSAHLNAMNVRFKSHLPWALAVSFAQATQQPALEIWTGDNTHVLAAQQALYHRAQCHCAGRRGEYTRAVEK